MASTLSASAMFSSCLAFLTELLQRRDWYAMGNVATGRLLSIVAIIEDIEASSSRALHLM